MKKIEVRTPLEWKKEKKDVRFQLNKTKRVDQSKTRALMRDFQRVDRAFLSAQDWSGNFNKSSFQGREMRRRMTFGKDRKFIVAVV